MPAAGKCSRRPWAAVGPARAARPAAVPPRPDPPRRTAGSRDLARSIRGAGERGRMSRRKQATPRSLRRKYLSPARCNGGCVTSSNTRSIEKCNNIVLYYCSIASNATIAVKDKMMYRYKKNLKFQQIMVVCKYCEMFFITNICIIYS